MRKVVVGGLAVGAGVVAVRARRAERAHPDVVAELVRLPPGDERVVVASDGARLAVTDAPGPRHPVVLSHCWTGNRTTWAPVARRLHDAGHRVVLWEQRGHGASTLGEEPISLARLGEDLRDVLDGLDLSDAVLAGHSMGGMTVMALLASDPKVVAERARRIVLVATAAAGVGRHPRVDSAVARAIGSSAVTAAFAGPVGHRLARGSVGRRPRPEHVAVTARLFAETEASTRAECFAGMAAMDLRHGLAACPVPAAVVVGRRDQLTPPRHAREIAARLPQATLTVIPDAGHMLPFEEPDRVAELISS
jgi:non-heme chloroperoxidase